MSFWSGISVVMIVLDAEELLADALASVPQEAEIIVADGGSEDRTVTIARKFGARVIAQNLAAIAEADGNFDVARNEAAEHAMREWIFFLDADERITEELYSEIHALNAPGDAFELPRINLYWGKPVRLLGEDRQIRLVKKGRGRYEGTALHQKLLVDGSVGQLGSPLLHLNLRGWSDVSLRFRRYLPSEARHHAPVPTRRKAMAVSCHMFRYYYFRSGAWKDGWRGILVSLIYSVYHGAAAWQARPSIDA